MYKHAWMLDVLSDLGRYAAENDLHSIQEPLAKVETEVTRLIEKELMFFIKSVDAQDSRIM